MFYIVAYDHKLNGHDSSSFASILGEYGESRMIFSGLWLLTSEYKIDLNKLCKEIKVYLMDNQSLFISELAEGNANGWLPVTIWDWYKSNTNNK